MGPVTKSEDMKVASTCTLAESLVSSYSVKPKLSSSSTSFLLRCCFDEVTYCRVRMGDEGLVENERALHTKYGDLILSCHHLRNVSPSQRENKSRRACLFDNDKKSRVSPSTSHIVLSMPRSSLWQPCSLAKKCWSVFRLCLVG
jgi:hypothetical protein